MYFHGTGVSVLEQRVFGVAVFTFHRHLHCVGFWENHHGSHSARIVTIAFYSVVFPL